MKIQIRKAKHEDINRLHAINNHSAHKDRINDSEKGQFDFLVVEIDGLIEGSSIIAFEYPSAWPEYCKKDKYPCIIDLYINPEKRSFGIGKLFVEKMELLVKEKHMNSIYLQVNPTENQRAFSFYKRLGYIQISEPYLDHWQYTDDSGTIHKGEEFLIDMQKNLI